MKKLLFCLMIFAALDSTGQVVNRLRDSTWFKANTQFDAGVRITTNPGSGKVLTSDAIGNAAWQASTGGFNADSVAQYAWLLTGNSGTTAGTNFIGTTDNASLVFKINNTFAGRIGRRVPGNSNVSIGEESCNGGSENTAIGTSALGSITTAFGVNNVGIGNRAGITVTTGSNNVIIGDDADAATATTSIAVALGWSAIAASNQFVVTDSVNVWLGATDESTNIGSETRRMDSIHSKSLITNALQLIDGTQGLGKVLTSDANGLASWQTGSATVGGSDKNVQYNNAGSPGGVTNNSTATNKFLRQVSDGTPSFEQVAATDLSGYEINVDWTASAAATGFSAFTNESVVYSRIGEMVFIHAIFNGTSNATTITFTLPYTALVTNQLLGAAITNNGVASNNPGMIIAIAGTATANCYRDRSLTAFTNSGAKVWIMDFWYIADL